MNRSKQIIGYAFFLLLSPCVVLGAVVYLIADAVVYGWKTAEEMMEGWNNEPF